jgi:hypothetical protein
MPEIFNENQRLRIIAVVLALLAWGYVRFFSGSSQRSEVHVTIPLTVIGLQHGEQAHTDPQTVTIVGAPALQNDQTVRAVVDAGSRTAGVYLVPVLIETSQNVASLAPANVTLTIDEESK